MKTNRPLIVAAILLIGLMPVLATAQQPKQIERAKPPTFNPAEYEGIFFNNVAADALVGERPANIGAPVNIVNTRPATGGPAVGETPAAAAGGGGGVFPWSEIISRETLEDQVKAVKIRIDQGITTPSDFRGRGYLTARREFTILALMFGIIGEYDGDVRWKEVAPGMREQFARSAGNSKVGSIQAYNDAKARKADLQDLVGGGSPAVTEAEAAAAWDKTIDRSPLMQMLEMVHQGKLQRMVASKAEFDANQEEIKRYAEIIAAAAEVLTKENMPDGDDEEYANLSKRMKAGALKIVDGIKLNNYENARAGDGEISKACTECHEFYKG